MFYIPKKIHYFRILIFVFKPHLMNTISLKTAISKIFKIKPTNYRKITRSKPRLLEANISYYDWVGFYFKNGAKDELKLAQYTGEETEHTIIPFWKRNLWTSSSQ